MKKSLLALTAIVIFLFSSCSDDSDILTGKSTPAGTTTNTNTNTGVTTTKVCNLKEIQTNDNGDLSKLTYTYGADGTILKLEGGDYDVNCEYDKNKNLTKLIFAEDKRNYFEYIYDSKGVLSNINFIFFDETSKKTYTIKNSLVFNAAGLLTKYNFNLDIFEALFSSIGGKIELTNEIVPIDFTYDKNSNLTKVTITEDKTVYTILENTAFDSKKTPFSLTQYRINLSMGMILLAFNQPANYNYFNKNNATASKMSDNDDKPVTISYTYDYSTDNFPTKSTMIIKGSTGEKKLIENFTYDCK